jgi:hypothetical protein
MFGLSLYRPRSTGKSMQLGFLVEWEDNDDNFYTFLYNRLISFFFRGHRFSFLKNNLVFH